MEGLEAKNGQSLASFFIYFWHMQATGQQMKAAIAQWIRLRLPS